MRSARESSWTPKGEVAPTRRATAPSQMSITIARTISSAAQWLWLLKASGTAENPHAMFAAVNMLGAVTRRRSFGGSCRSETTSAPDCEAIRNRRRRRIRRRRRRTSVSAARASSATARLPAGVPAPEHGLAGDGAVTGGNGQLDLGRQEDVHAGPELHQPDAGARRDGVPGADPGDDPARHRADDLAEHHGANLAGDLPLHGDVAALVLRRALELVRRQPLARPVGHVRHRPAVGRPVDVHVEDREEDADLLPV